MSFLTKKFGRFTGFVWILLVVGGGGLLTTVYYLWLQPYFTLTSAETQKIELSDEQRISLQTAPANIRDTTVLPPFESLSHYGTEKSTIPGALWKWDAIPWNATSVAALANGGAFTKKNSLLEKAGIRLKLSRVDMYSDIQENMLKFAEAFSTDPSSTQGTQFCTIMGDAAPIFVSGLNDKLKEINPEYKAEVFYVTGRSAGEDAFIGPQRFLDDPQNLRGATCIVVMLDGDQNIPILYAEANGIPINPDPNTYDPKALNFKYVDDFMQTPKEFLLGKAETRINKVTGKEVQVTPNCFATWTPGDVYFSDNYTGDSAMVRILSTHENINQMLCTVIGLNKHLAQESQKIAKMLCAFDEAGNRIKTYPSELMMASNAIAEVFSPNDKEKTGAWWNKYYIGDTVKRPGYKMYLGGSGSLNLSEAADAMGVGEEASGYYKTTYTTFGDLYVKLFPTNLSKYTPVDEVFNGKYVQLAFDQKKKAGQGIAGETPKVYATGTSEKVVTKRDWAIEFNSGQASLTAKGVQTLKDVLGQLTISAGLRIRISGYTDSDGNAETNRVLSESRANAVRDYLMKNGGGNFSKERFEAVKGLGVSEKFSNAVAAEKAKNRRVEISLVE
jgi:OmpA-OmpF porin, OOP family